MPNGISFVTGGIVPYDVPVYIQRHNPLRNHQIIEQEVLKTIVHKKKYATVIGPRQVGKTSLLNWLSAMTKSTYDYATVHLDLSPLNDPMMKSSDWVQEFCIRLREKLRPFADSDISLDLPTNIVKLKSYWQNLARFINTGTILICLDEANSVPPHILDVFYSNIREIGIEQTSDYSNATLKRLRFVFAGAFEPQGLIKDRKNSPFNISEIYRLPDFSQAETAELLNNLVEKHSIQLDSTVIKRIHYWTDGHPYLIQYFAHLMDEDLTSHTKVTIDTTYIDGLLPVVKSEASDNIDHIGRRTLDYLRGIGEIDFLARILKGDFEPFTRVEEKISELELIGAIKEGDQGQCQIRNPIVADVLRNALKLPKTLEAPNKSSQITRPASSLKQTGLTTINIFYSYSHKDEALKEELEKHLKIMSREGLLKSWHDRCISPGK